MSARVQTIAERIEDVIRLELSEEMGPNAQLIAAFTAVRCTPYEVTVQYSGGLMQRCWQVTRSDGDCAVVYMSRAGYFALCVTSAVGLLDIGVHGPVLGCFGSV